MAENLRVEIENIITGQLNKADQLLKPGEREKLLQSILGNVTDRIPGEDILGKVLHATGTAIEEVPTPSVETARRIAQVADGIALISREQITA